MIIYWLPAFIGGTLAWIAFVTSGQTPFVRATGLALVVVGVTLTLRRLGALLALTGGLALAFSPAFWSQTGGGDSIGTATTVVALAAASLAAIIIIQLSNRPYIALGLGAAIFAIIFWGQIGTPRSLRLTGLLTAWLLFLLVDALFTSNPRPDEAQPAPIDKQHIFGLLIILCVGTLNDPLFVLLMPAVAIGLWLSWTSLPRWFWGTLIIVSLIGIRGIMVTYIDAGWWNISAAEAQKMGTEVPYILADGWRVGSRWVNLMQIIIQQFTVLGATLSILGLARLSRWYPVLGIVSMVAYGFYAIFGLVYFGADREILLMPLFIIQIIWLTYAVYTFGQWLEKSLRSNVQRAHWLATSAYVILPVYLFLLVTRVT
ncbi:MAG: hypothetical protein H7Y09_05540 [Chitinophagaceae bacterium]|nr:hypothetical protein [Anaerolineae bacterium]